MAGQPKVERQAALVKRKSAWAGGQDLRAQVGAMCECKSAGPARASLGDVRAQVRGMSEAFLPCAVGSIHELTLRLPRCLHSSVTNGCTRVQRKLPLSCNASLHSGATVHCTRVLRMVSLSCNGGYFESATADTSLVQVAVPLQWKQRAHYPRHHVLSVAGRNLRAGPKEIPPVGRNDSGITPAALPAPAPIPRAIPPIKDGRCPLQAVQLVEGISLH